MIVFVICIRLRSFLILYVVQNRKSYIPRRKTRDELHIEAKQHVKKSWRDSGIGGSYFSQAPIMKPKLLDPWVQSRVQAPEKASTKFFFSKYICFVNCQLTQYLPNLNFFSRSTSLLFMLLTVLRISGGLISETNSESNLIGFHLLKGFGSEFFFITFPDF